MSRPNRLLTLSGLLALGSLTGCGGVVYHERMAYAEPPPQRVVVAQPVPAADVDVEEEQPPVEVVTTFEQDLSPYGRWVVVGNYGRCFVPRGVARDWRPYTVGHWTYSDYGWTWDSEEPWGYATCHYGRWFEDPTYGWVWVPGTTWGPAWVAWRSGDGYVGWAPLGPDIRLGASVEISTVQTERIPAARFCFVAERDLCDERRIDTHIVDFHRNTTIINKTTNITNITVVNNRVVNRSVNVERIERDTGRRVQRTSVKEVTSAAEARQARQHGEIVQYRPKAVEEAHKRVVEKRTNNERARTDNQRARPQAAQPNNVNQAERNRAAEAERARSTDAERAKAQATERTRAQELERTRAQQQSERNRVDEAQRARQQDAEKAKAQQAERQRATEAERSRTQTPDRTKANETERARTQTPDRTKTTEAERAKAQQNERARAAESERARANQASERAKANEAEKSRAAETKRQESDRSKAAENRDRPANNRADERNKDQGPDDRPNR